MEKASISEYNSIFSFDKRLEIISEQLGHRLFLALQRIEGYSMLVTQIQPRMSFEPLEIRLEFLITLLNIPSIEFSSAEVRSLVRYRNTLAHFNPKSLIGKSFLKNWERALLELERLNRVLHKYCMRVKVNKDNSNLIASRITKR